MMHAIAQQGVSQYLLCGYVSYILRLKELCLHGYNSKHMLKVMEQLIVVMLKTTLAVGNHPPTLTSSLFLLPFSFCEHL